MIVSAQLSVSVDVVFKINKYIKKGRLAWHSLELFGQQRLVGVEDASVGDDHGGADVHLLLSFEDTDTWNHKNTVRVCVCLCVSETCKNKTHHKPPGRR